MTARSCATRIPMKCSYSMPHGTYLHSLDGLAGWLPGALAALGRRVYVADAASGAIHAFDDDGAHIGAVPGYRGPVTALAVASSGDSCQARTRRAIRSTGR